MSARIAETVALSPSSFRKRYRSSYETSSSSSISNPSSMEEAVLVVETPASNPLGLGYEALRRRELAVEEDQVPSTFVVAYAPPTILIQTPPSLEWLLGSLPVSPSSFVVPSSIVKPMATLTATISVDEDQLIERYKFRSLEREQGRATMTFKALWRPVLALEAWAGRVNTRLADMSQDMYDDHRLIHDMLVHQAAMQRELQEMRSRVTL
nr:hypothetical protein [Tanacetum cinerariifolium]